MSLKFKGEDFLMLLLPELKEHHEADITFRRLNGLREKLREKGATYDLGLRELESLSYDYPENIAIEHTEIKVKMSKSFMEFFELKIKSYDKDAFCIYQELWEETR